MVLRAKLLTEFVGTFIFFSVIALSGPIGALAPLAIGSVLMAMVYMGGHISGAHYNPAVSFGVFLRRKLGSRELFLYWAVQLLAAMAAFGFGHAVSGHTPGIHPGGNASTAQALAVEIMFTAALVLVVLNVAVTRATAGNSFYGRRSGSRSSSPPSPAVRSRVVPSTPRLVSGRPSGLRCTPAAHGRNYGSISSALSWAP